MEQYYNSWLIGRLVNGKDMEEGLEYRVDRGRNIMRFPSFFCAMMHLQTVTGQPFDELYVTHEIHEENERYVH